MGAVVSLHLFDLGSVGEGLPHAENTGLVISDTAKICNFFHFLQVFLEFFFCEDYISHLITY